MYKIVNYVIKGYFVTNGNYYKQGFIDSSFRSLFYE